MHAKTAKLIAIAREILAEGHPMTVRQVFYQLVSRQVVKNNRGRYQAVSDALVNARRAGDIPWPWIEDRLRRPRHVAMWAGLPDFADTCRRSYRRDVWETQPCYLEAWLEKDALSGIFEAVLNPYGVTLNVGRGYDGWSSVHNAAGRYGAKETTILYFGDHDPSGVNMGRSLIKRLADLGATPNVIKCALTHEDIRRYNLPPNYAKTTDSRTPAFIAEYGNATVELDALPPDVLRDRIRKEVEDRMDLRALKRLKTLEARERAALVKLLERA